MAARDAAAHEAIEALREALNSLGTLEVRTEPPNAALLGYGWWVRIVRTSQAIARLAEEGFYHEAAPLRRTVLHHTAALAWLAKDHKTAFAAVRYQHQQKQQKLVTIAMTRDWDLSAIDLPKKAKQPAPAALQYLERVEDLCDYVGLSTSGYAAFSVESFYVHPSALGADAYFAPRSEHGDGGHLLTYANADDAPLRSVAGLAIEATKALGALTGDDRLSRLAERVQRDFAQAENE